MNEEKNTLSYLDHVAIKVDSIAEAVKWYETHLSCTVTWQDESWAFLQLANCGLALVAGDRHPPHVAVLTPSADVFGDPDEHRDGTRSVYLLDESGNALEMLERPDPVQPNVE